MKRIVAILLAALLMLGSANALVVQPEEYNTNFYSKTGLYTYDAYVLCDSLTLRSKPDIYSRALRQLSHGQKLYVSMQQGEWYHVYATEHVEGWVKAEYLVVNPALYVTEAETPAYAYGSRYAPRVALINPGETLPIIHSTMAYYVVSLRGASAWIERPEARDTEEFNLATLQNITHASLTCTDPQSGQTLYQGEVTDPAALARMGNLLADADDKGGPVSNCPFSIALLTLTFADGSNAVLDLACDDCCVFRVNGRDYAYARSLFTAEGAPKNSELFSLFTGANEALGR